MFCNIICRCESGIRFVYGIHGQISEFFSNKEFNLKRKTMRPGYTDTGTGRRVTFHAQMHLLFMSMHMACLRSALN
jgi:hypothetical protein